MLKTLGDLRADLVPPESQKFKSSIVMVHDLWSSSAQWSEWANHFANLGWESWAINLRGRAGLGDADVLARLKFPECEEDLAKAVRDLSFPPVLLGHGFGGLLASKVAQREQVFAVVLLSPYPAARQMTSDALRLLRVKYFALLLLRRPFSLQEKDFRQLFLASVPPSRQTEILKRLVPESGHLMHEFFRQRAELNLGNVLGPVLVIGGTENKIVPVSILRATATKLGADFLEYRSHGHWIMGEAEGERIVRDIHRWLVQKLGEKILIAEFPESVP